MFGITQNRQPKLLREAFYNMQKQQNAPIRGLIGQSSNKKNWKLQNLNKKRSQQRKYSTYKKYFDHIPNSKSKKKI